MKNRCQWATQSEIEQVYHDTVWGKPEYDDGKLFEMLILEGMQAGLSWITILKKREAMKEAFDQFDYRVIAGYDDEKIEALLQNEGIIRNRLKLRSLAINAQAFMRVQEEYGSFREYLWQFVNHQPVINHWQTAEEVPASTPLSDLISKDLKKKGFKFIGTTIVYAYMQAIGMVNDHTAQCYLYPESSSET